VPFKNSEAEKANRRTDKRRAWKRANYAKHAVRWRVENKAKYALKSRAGLLKKQYGLSLSDYAGMLEKQRGLCALCNLPESIPGAQLCVDHNHTTQKVRALLCRRCNAGIGHLNDSAERCRAAAAYLEKHDG
jgi:hypothetical protein